MRKFTQLFFIFSVLALMSVRIYAQQVITIGTGTSVNANTSYGPVYRFGASSTTTYSRSNMLFSASELAAAGILPNDSITEIRFTKANNGYFLIPVSHKIYMANSNRTSLSTSETWAGILSTHTLVRSVANLTLSPAAGTESFVLQTNFKYTGGALEIAFEHNMTSGTTGASDKISWTYTSGITTDMMVGATGTGTTQPATLNGTVTAYRNRPNIQMVLKSGSVCTNPPTAGIISSSTSNVCNGIPFTLQISGSSTGSGTTFQLQKSTDNITYTNVDTPRATPSFSITQNGSTWYRVQVQCNGGTTAPSNAIQVTSPALVSGNFFINNNSPTAGNNFNSFAEAINYISCGINGPVNFTFEASSGPYNEQISIPHVFGTSAANRIRINGNGVKLSFTGTANARHTLQLNGADWVVIDSLQIAGESPTYGYGIHLTNGANNNTITRCLIDNSVNTSTAEDNSGGIIVSGSPTDVNVGGGAQFLRISRNRFTGGYQGISVVGATPDSVKGMQIDSNTVADFYITGIRAASADSGFIHHNNIHRLNRVSPISTFEGIEMNANTGRMRIFSNRIHDTHTAVPSNTTGAYGLFDNQANGMAGKENIYYNNLIYNFTGTGLQYGIYNLNGDNTWYQHNTIVLNGTNSGTGVTRGFYQLTDAQGVRLQNNIILSTRTGSGTGTRHAIYIGTSTSEVISNRNILQVNAAGSTSGIGFISSNYPTLDDWKGANGGIYDANSLSRDPLFESVADSNYTPTDPLINGLGSNLGITADILGRPRTSNPDPGAFEYTPPSCSGPAVSGILNSNVVTVCQNTLFNLSLTGQSTGLNTTYEFQRRKLGTITWISLKTLPTASLDTLQTDSSEYRVLVRCNGGSASTSNTIQVFSPAPVQGTYTINPSAPASANNFITLASATAYAGCGVSGPVIFNVTPGSAFSEQLILNPINGASATNTIRFNGRGSSISFNSTNSSERAIVKLNGADHITIDSFVLSSSSFVSTEYAYGVQLLNDADSNTISNCIINVSTTPTTASSTGYAGIVINSSAIGTPTSSGTSLCDYNTLRNNTITGGYSGISIYGNTSTSSVTGNRVENNIIRDFYIYGIAINGGVNTVISGNDISRPTRTSVTSFNGIYFANANRGALVVKNKIHHSFQAVTTPSNTHSSYGINFSSADGLTGQENVVANNFIYSFNGDGIQNGILNTGSSHAWYFHNSVLLDDQTVSQTSNGSTRGFYQTSDASNIQLINNIFSINRSGTLAKEVLYFNTPSSVIRSRNNNLYISTPSATTSSTGYYNGVLYPSLSSWQAINYDTSSLSVVPGFVSDTDLHLVNNAPVRDSGMVIPQISDDIDGQMRSGSFRDMGADELPGVVLTARITHFAGFAAKDYNSLYWTLPVAGEYTSFTIERSEDGLRFSRIGYVPVQSGTEYNFSDIQPLSGNNFYRLLMDGPTGRSTISKVILVNRKKALLQIQIAPNPVTELVSGHFALPITQDAVVQLMDASGAATGISSYLKAGSSRFGLQMSPLPAGKYYLIIRKKDGTILYQESIFKM